MKKKLQLIFAAVLVSSAVVFSGCGGDDPVDPKKTCYLNKIAESATDYTEYRYDGSNRVEKTTVYKSGVVNKSSTIKYTSSGNIEQQTNYDDKGIGIEIVTPTYNSDGTIAKVVSKSKNGSGNFDEYLRFEYEYNSAKQLSKTLRYDDNTLTLYSRYEYNGNGNITKVTDYYDSDPTNPDLLGTREYTYDDKKNPEYTYMSKLNPETSKNNIASLVTKDNVGSVDANETYTFAHTYDGEGNPTGRTQTYDGGAVKAFTLTYDCK